MQRLVMVMLPWPCYRYVSFSNDGMRSIAWPCDAGRRWRSGTTLGLQVTEPGCTARPEAESCSALPFVIYSALPGILSEYPAGLPWKAHG